MPLPEEDALCELVSELEAHGRAIHRVQGRVRFEDPDGGALMAAQKRYMEILDMPRDNLPEEVKKEIMSKVPGVFEKTLKS